VRDRHKILEPGGSQFGRENRQTQTNSVAKVGEAVADATAPHKERVQEHALAHTCAEYCVSDGRGRVEQMKATQNPNMPYLEATDEPKPPIAHKNCTSREGGAKKQVLLTRIGAPELTIDRSRAHVLHIDVYGSGTVWTEAWETCNVQSRGSVGASGGGQKPVDESQGTLRPIPNRCGPHHGPASVSGPGSLPGRKHANANGPCSVPGQHPLVRPDP
jgi:hypothetical protein